MFKSFFLAGFECATGINSHHQPFDQIAATGHDLHVDDDYRRLAENGICALREGVRWPLVDQGGRHDFSSVEPFLAAAQRYGLTVLWDLFHYGYPADLDPSTPPFTARFADYCRAAAAFLAARSPAPWYFTPINEPSYFAWAAGEVGLFAPHRHGCGRELKIALVAAAIAAINAIRSVCPQARLVNVDPLCRVVPAYGRPERAEGAEHFNHHAVFEAWDMLAGRLHPELGGSRSHLDIIGINYYADNQWEIGYENRPLTAHDPRRAPLHALVAEVARRYGGDLLITETSAVDGQRAPWIAGIVDQVELMRARGIALQGVCLYPVLGMPEWHDRQRWTAMGLWDVDTLDPRLARIPYAPALDALRAGARRLGAVAPGG